MRALVALVLLAACNAEDEGPVARSRTGGGDDSGPAPVQVSDAGLDAGARAEGADAEELESRLAQVLQSDDFRDATCRLAAVAATARDPTLSCEQVVTSCLEGFGSLDASAAVSATLPDVPLALPDCELTVEQVDACLAELASVLVDVSSGLECGADAGAVFAAVGPEALLQAPSCLFAAVTCPALLDLFAAALPQLQ